MRPLQYVFGNRPDWSYNDYLKDRFEDLWLKHEITKGEYEYRNIDGTNNNLDDPYSGAAGNYLIRVAPAAYLEDGYTPIGDSRPSAREVSNEIFTQLNPIPNEHKVSDMFWLWGQFIDHDIDLTHTTNEAYFIDIPTGDAYFDPYGEGNKQMDFFRSAYDPDTGTTGVPREQINEITSYLDGSNVYGSDQERADYLRTFKHGMLKTSDNNLLPFNEDGLDNAGGPDSSLFIAGDVRANEHVGLTAMHTLFVREHNHWAEQIFKWDPTLGDEEIYQRAKMIVTAEIQAITFNEFLPLLLGENAIPEYQGYNHDVNPDIANIFSTAAYRLGHTLLSSTIYRLDEDGNPISDGNLALRDAFFSPDAIVDQGEIASIMRGFAYGQAETLDAQMIDEVRNFLFGPPGAGGFDLAALNIQRGRDHGLPDYNTARVAYGLDPVTQFSDITSDVTLQNKLSALYGDVNNIDVFVGGLCEDTKEGSMMGELFHTIVLDQFLRLRDGDRHWYENKLPEKIVDMVDDTTLSDIIIRNTEVKYLQEFSMLNYDRISGTNHDDTMYNDNDDPNEAGDLMIALNGNDIIYGLDGDDHIYGGKGDDHIYGGEGDDHIYGGKGHDTINGGEGNDYLEGGEGKDHFVFENESGHDHIKDFRPGKDKIDVKDYNLSEQELLAGTQQDGNNTVINLSPYSTITLENVTPDDLSTSDFILM